MDINIQPVRWEPGTVCLIDQTRLPHTVDTIRCRSVDDVVSAIRRMVVRGAPAIGVTAAYGMVIGADAPQAHDRESLLGALADAKARLDSARPTAVNLAWATRRILEAVTHSPSHDLLELRTVALREAEQIHADDVAMCYAIGEHGAPLIADGASVLTHCNAGGLATTGYGTAIAPIRTAHSAGKRVHVFVDETRPFLQGARLTAWELKTVGIPQTLITDSMAGYFMARGDVHCVIVGADRIVANGDVANKIGTYSVAVLAHAHGIPFYVAAPSSTIDTSLADGSAIPIEERDPDEVTHLAGQPLTAEGVSAAHPAFDVTPARLVSGYITERGVFRSIADAVAAEPQPTGR